MYIILCIYNVVYDDKLYVYYYLVFIRCFVHSLHRSIYSSIFLRVCQVISSYSVQILCCSQCRSHINIGYGGTPLTWCQRLRRGFIDNLLILKRFLNSNGLSLVLSILLFFVAIVVLLRQHNIVTPPPMPFVSVKLPFISSVSIAMSLMNGIV